MAKTNNQPALSVIVVVYNMPKQAMNTLYSLSRDYQLGVAQDQYEVIVVENASGNNLKSDEISRLNGNFRYFLRDETRPTPVYAVNFAASEARAPHICLMIDGARMVSPRVIQYTLAALRMNEQALVAVPGYHIGEQDQRYHQDTAHDHQSETELLQDTAWKENGYRLFKISCVSRANTHGCFHPLMESNCLTFSKSAFVKIGMAHEGFQSPGGGSVNLDIYRNLALLPESQLIILAGEGSFHQFHGGVTTSQADDLEEVWAAHREEFRSIRGQYYCAVLKQPTIFGSIGSYALPFFLASSKRGQKRFSRFNKQGDDPWKDDNSRQQ